jgi:hypothetical protein
MACLVTGVSWAAVPDAAEFGIFLLVVSLLGGSALAAGGLWQGAAGPKTRVFVLVRVAALSGAYVAANTIGLLLTASSASSVAGLATVRWAHWVGVVLGGSLYLLSLAEGLVALRVRDGALSGDGP